MDITEIIERKDFANAREKYNALTQSMSPTKYSPYVSSAAETFKMSGIEGMLFGIDEKEIGALFWAYERYESFVGSQDGCFDEFRDAERAEYAELFVGERIWNFAAAVAFMSQSCGIPYQKCIAWVTKILSANLRAELYN